MNLTPTGFGIIVAILLLLAIGVAIAENLHDAWVKAARMIDAAPGPDDDRLARDVARYHCAGHGCYLVVVSSDSRGTRWECAVCKTQSWVPTTVLYDQQADVSEWEREVGA